MAIDRYRLSFTTGGLFGLDAPLVAAHYLQSGNWAETRQRIRAGNLLQVRTSAAALRISKELVERLATLDDQELVYLSECNPHDGAHLLWVAACRRYALIREFAVEALRERALLMQRQLVHGDYDTFISGKALWHDELDALAPSTQRKLRQNLFRMLREAGLVSDSLSIQRVNLGRGLIELLAPRGASQFTVFPVSDADIQRWLR